MSDYEEKQRLKGEWEEKRREWQQLHDRWWPGGYTPVEWPSQGEPTPEAIEHISAAKMAEEEAYQRFLNVFNR